MNNDELLGLPPRFPLPMRYCPMWQEQCTKENCMAYFSSDSACAWNVYKEHIQCLQDGMKGMMEQILPSIIEKEKKRKSEKNT